MLAISVAFWWFFSGRFVSFFLDMSTYLCSLSIFCLKCVQNRVSHDTSVTEWCFVHSTITGRQVLLLYLNTKLEVYVAYIHQSSFTNVHTVTTNVNFYSSYKISINSLHLQFKATSNKNIHTYSSMCIVMCILVLQFQVPNTSFSFFLPNI